MTDAGVIRSTRRERELHYALSDPDYIMNILVSMKDILAEDAVKRFPDIWSKLGPR